MANSTDPFAQSVHGTNPQYLIEKITRLKIYNCVYWKEQCFGLTSETIMDKAVALKYIGGTYGGNLKPTNFLCLVLKLLQLQPEVEIIAEFIKNEDFKYLRALGAFYLRLVGKVDMIYQYLEPLMNDYRKLSYRGMSGWMSMHMDEFVDSLLRDELVCDMALPHLVRRMKLEEQGLIEPRKSALDDEIAAAGEDSSDESEDESDGEEEKQIIEPSTANTEVAAAAADDDEDDDWHPNAGLDAPVSSASNTLENNSNGGRNHERPDERKSRDRHSSRDRDQRDYHRRDSSASPDSRHRGRREDSRDRSDRRDRRDSDRRDRSSDRHRDSDRRQKRDRSPRGDSEDRHRSRHAHNSSGNGSSSRRSHSRSPTRRDSRRGDRDKDRDRDRDRDSRDRDDRHQNRSDRRRRSRTRSPDPRGRDSHRDRDNHRDGDRDRDHREERRDDDRDTKRSRRDDDKYSTTAKYQDQDQADEDLPMSVSDKTVGGNNKAQVERKFDRMFGSSKSKAAASASASGGAGGGTRRPSGPPATTNAAPNRGGSGGGGGGGKEVVNTKGEKVTITASEGSVEYWNQMREALGLKKLK